jgi:AcrR family transcriptional regulator
MQKGRKSTQRERLLNGVVQAANRGGYSSANVSAIIRGAGVSRPTFYDYFTDRDDAFKAAIDDISSELLDHAKDALRVERDQDPACVVAAALVAYTSEHPSRARFLMAESMAGGAQALQARDRGVAELAAIVASSQKRISSDNRPLVDLPPEILVGTVYRILATRLRRGEPVSKLGEELLAWIATYERPADERRWQSLAPGPEPARSPHLPDGPIQRMPSVFPPGRPRISEEEIAENHRLRILYAAARLAEEKGYTATTVADITRLARVDGRIFYRLFSDKQEAFTAVHELGFQQVMDVTGKAFFAAEGWPDRSWEGGRALAQLLQDNPLVAHVGFVEAYAFGPRAVQRIEDSHTAFMFFLQEGLVYTTQENPPSRLAMEAIISGVFEIIYLRSRERAEPKLASMLGQIAHLWLTPFLGTDEADAFIDSRLLPPSRKPRPPRKPQRPVPG